MNQHPVPQNISSYEFRLVGDMTLKQFFQLAGGAVIALIFYASGLPGIVKWPLVAFFSLFGAALAFMPLEERPLSTWILAFFKAIYSPTQYTWAQGGAEEVFSKDSATPLSPSAPTGIVEAQENLAKTPQAQVLSTFEEAEKSFLQKISSLFQTTPTPDITIGKIAQSQQPPMPAVEMGIPPTQPVKIQAAPPKPPVKPAPAVKPEFAQQGVSPVFHQAQTPSQAGQAVFAPEAAPPNPPAVPNTVVGQVLTADGGILEGAILEIRDSERRPVRALKTNKVGHFLTVTPIKNGVYEIETEKEGFSFDIIKVSAEGKIIPPILIRGKATP
ncbi:MAG: PrgI family protein [Candidatus Blackburnbacteria bacterium]|nr:PrgI family protein [Candidatus Blackburnbacteria bacterium]